MSLQKSRYESQNIVNSFNLFVDTQKAAVIGDGQSTGDNYLIHLGDNAFSAQDGEIVRISLVNFNMFNNIYGVNINNCKFRVTTQVGATIQSTLKNLARGNYKTVGAVAQNFGEVLAAELLAQAQAIPAAAGGPSTATTATPTTLPAAATALNATDDRLISTTIVFDANHLLVQDQIFVQCFRQVGDSYALLGALGIDGDDANNNVTDNSFKITVVNATSIKVEAFFPGQRLTEPNLYVRVAQTNNGLESVVSSDPVGNTRTNRYEGEVINSNILAKIHRDVEFINFETGSSDEYFVNLQQRKVSSLRIFLTDSKARPLGRPFNAPTLSQGTASGLEDPATGVFESQEQNTRGNLFFDAVLKIEIIKVSDPKQLDTTPPPPPLPAREAQSVLTWQDYGRPRF